MTEKEMDFIEQLYRSQYEKLFLYVYINTQDRELAENLVNDTFLDMADKVETLSGHPNPSGWLREAVKLKLRQHFRWSQRQRKRFVSLEISDRPIESFEQSMLLTISIQKALTEEEYAFFSSYVFDGYTHEQLAQEYHISVPVSQKRLERIRKRLRKKLK